MKKAGLSKFMEGNVNCLQSELTLDAQADLLPYDKTYEFPRDKIELGRVIGSGAFGKVYLSSAEGILSQGEKTDVAIKMAENIADNEMMKALISELKIMIYLGKHLNVLNLLGAVTKNISKRELLIIVEFCPFGNVQSFLTKHRRYFVNQIVHQTDEIDPKITSNTGSSNNLTFNSLKRNNLDGSSFLDSLEKALNSASPLVTPNKTSNSGPTQKEDSVQAPLRSVTTTDLLIWSFQIARGMQYLASRKVLHGDLAARNILLCEGNVVKICDFGLARSMYNKDCYRKNRDKEALLPLKWLALESINDFVFSSYSDVWSFGVVLWELFSLGATPYPDINPKIGLKKLLNDGYRMEKPEFATQAIYDIMLSCWCVQPEKRPLFNKLESNISKLLGETVSEHYVDLNDPYVQANASRFNSGKTDYFALLGTPDCEAPCVPIRVLHEKYFPFLTDLLDGTPTATNNLYVAANTSKSTNKYQNDHDNRQFSTFKRNNLH
ncbi:vascular endothelial growth factor receptor 3-like [Contarinia nasturtii]|uniref:vascular endothelial growth factor receptor 3-like n=1 Tax=Contarinia nasturtii TaxID=265458 RepID=UPI0012D40F5B|nr:vascular endothelial growth factor receptor 3-like [Contarinia nasturtii]